VNIVVTGLLYLLLCHLLRLEMTREIKEWISIKKMRKNEQDDR